MPTSPYVMFFKEESWKALSKNTLYITKMYKGVKLRKREK